MASCGVYCMISPRLLAGTEMTGPHKPSRLLSLIVLYIIIIYLYVQVEHVQGSVMEHLSMDQDHHLVMDHDHPPPTEDEQQRMAELWAMEEVNAPRGWEDEEELDYTVLSQRQAEHPGVSPERKGSGE